VNRLSKNTLGIGALVATLVAACLAVFPVVVRDAGPHAVDQLPFGNLSNADDKDHDNFLVKHDAFALSFNQSKKTPNWVSWRLARGDIDGHTERKSNFVQDLALPVAVDQASQVRYEHSGFDLGHVCPYADRESTSAAAWSTFVMTNVMPQYPNLNRGPWEGYEDYVRKSVRQNGDVAYIAAGPAGSAGTFAEVTVPEKCWKVVYFTGGKNLPAGWSAVIMPNKPDAGTRDDWHKYQVLKEAVEELTGYKFKVNP
jgi:endonuclease G